MVEAGSFPTLRLTRTRPWNSSTARWSLSPWYKITPDLSLVLNTTVRFKALLVKRGSSSIWGCWPISCTVVRYSQFLPINSEYLTIPIYTYASPYLSSQDDTGKYSQYHQQPDTLHVYMCGENRERLPGRVWILGSVLSHNTHHHSVQDTHTPPSHTHHHAGTGHGRYLAGRNTDNLPHCYQVHTSLHFHTG